MTGFSQSALLQALGWATLNSFWQVGVLWCVYVLMRRVVKLKAGHHYNLAVFALLLSLLSFFGSIGLFFRGNMQVAGPFTRLGITSGPLFSAVLTAASLTYLALLCVPAARLVRNWRFLRRLRRSQLAKAPVHYRLYVQKIAGHLGIRQNVQVFLSALVQSPVTIGYLKPLILLPVAGFNQLTMQQAEAILLHELAHIRRFDYLINIGISLVHTLLYFNPFVRFFVREAEAVREGCCDETVLQFGYDRLAYAGALLHLEKEAAVLPQLVLGATGKNPLLARIEAIVGMPGKLPVLKMQHFAGLVTSVTTVLAVHSLLIIGAQEEKHGSLQILANLGNPFSLVSEEVPNASEQIVYGRKMQELPATVKTKVTALNAFGAEPLVPPPPPIPEAVPYFEQVVNIEDPAALLDEEELKQVEATVEATKKVLTTTEWKEVEQSIADGLTEIEKQQAYTQFQKHAEQIDWNHLKTHLAAHYHQTNWERLNRYLEASTYKMCLDSMETVYSKTLAHLEMLGSTQTAIALPDHSVDAIKSYQSQLRQVRDSIRLMRQKPIVRFKT